MTPALVMQLLIALTTLATEAVKSMTPEQAQKFWDRHNARMEFWEDVFKDVRK